MHNRLPSKWMWFRILNYFILLSCTGILMYVLFFLTTILVVSVNSILLLINIFSFLLLSADSVINLVLLEKYYPDKLPGRLFLIVAGIINILAIIFKSLLIFFTVVITIDWISTGSFGSPALSVLAYDFSLVVITITAVPVFVLRGNLKNLIAWNYKMNLERFLTEEQSNII